MNRPDRKLSRRSFLLAAGAGSVAATAAVVTGTGSREPGKAETVSGSKGYHVTEHIRKYYNTTKV